MNASNDERSATNSSTEALESIAMDALNAPQALLPHPTQERDVIDVQTALSKHPNIATRPDAMTTESSQPYEVVNHVDAQPIDHYCDRNRLDIHARLQLFAPVCRAVHFAHQHAVIHGALKPSNIVITADGVPKVMGFEIARVVGPKAAGCYERAGIDVASKMPTEGGECAAALECTSPEQLNGEPITTATDIYALGVVLYQLLTGRFPYRLRSRTRSDIAAAVFEQVPEKPSSNVTRCEDQRVAASAAMKPTRADTPPQEQFSNPQPCPSSSTELSTPQDIASARGSSPKRLGWILTGDLDAIVLMTLRKEPERRYASAEHFADDLSRYLQGLPVRAYGDSKSYRCASSCSDTACWLRSFC